MKIHRQVAAEFVGSRQRTSSYSDVRPSVGCQLLATVATNTLRSNFRHAAMIFVGVWLLLTGAVRSASAQTAVNNVTLEVFVRNDVESCQTGAEYARELAKQRGGIELRIYDVLADDDALRRFWALATRHKIEKPGMPMFFVFDQLRTGFTDAASSGPTINELLTIDVYSREGCPHCRDAKHFLTELLTRWPALRVSYHDASQDGPGLRRMYELAKRHGMTVTGLPAIHVGGKFFVGYNTDDTSGRQVEEAVRKMTLPPRKPPVAPQKSNEPKKTSRRFPASPIRLATAPIAMFFEPNRFGERGNLTLVHRASYDEQSTNSDVAAPQPPPPPAPPPPNASVDDPLSDLPDAHSSGNTVPEGIELPWLGMVRVRDLGLPVFTFLIGLVDGFNPCAMWVLVFLLSVLVNVKNRAKILAIAGTFVVVSGLAYYSFMAAWMNLFMLIGLARPLQIALGLLAIFVGVINVKDFVAFKQGVSLSIPESAKPGIYARVRDIVSAKYLSVAVGSAVVLAIVVNTIELLCTAGLPALYTQILTAQELPSWKNYGYLAIYITAYMLDDSLLLGTFVITLSHRKLQESEGRWLKLISGVVILILGAVMILKPDWLKLV